MPTHHHIKKSGINKAFKGESKNASKKKHGRMEAGDAKPVPVNVKHLQLNKRADRVNHSKQLQQNRANVINQKKRLGSKNGSPKIVAVISLSDSVDVEKIAHHLTTQCTLDQLIENPLNYSTTLTTQVEKKDARFTFIAVPRDPVAVADIAKVADVLYLVLSPKVAHYSDDEWRELHKTNGNNTTLDKEQVPFVDKVLSVDTLGNHFIQLLKAQGLPTTIGVVQGLSEIAQLKKQQFMSRLTQQYFHTLFDKDVSAFPLDNGEEQTQALLRATFNTIPREIAWREERTRMLAESVQWVANKGYDLAHQAKNTPDEPLYDMNKGTLKLTGFVRGTHSISANQLVHMTGFGDFQVLAIKAFENSHINPKTKQLPTALILKSDSARTSLEGLLASSEAAAMNGSSIAFESSDNMNMFEFNQTMQKSSDMATGVLNDTGNGASTADQLQVLTGAQSTFVDWRTQSTPYIKSFSALSSGTHVVQQDTPVFTQDVIDAQRRTDKNNIISSVWDSVDLDGAAKTDHLTVSRVARKTQLTDIMNGDMLASSDDEDDDSMLDEEAMSYRAIKREKKELQRHNNAADNLDSASSLMSSLSGFSMGSLRDPNLSPEQLKEKFQDLPYKEKVRRLLKYGEQGENKLLKVRTRMAKEDTTNPDEVDYHPSVTARARFVRYHAMAAFRHSVWDVNENLPAEYNQIVQFKNFDVSHRNAKEACALIDEDDRFSEESLFGNDEMYDDDDLDKKRAEAVANATQPDGSLLVSRINPDRMHPITVYIANVPEQVYNMLSTYKAYGLLWWLFNHERKVSVVHMKISRHTEYTAPVRSKDPMHVQIGFRRFLAAPIFSEIDPHVTDRGQVKRFLPIDDKPTYYMATMYSRITFPPATVLMFAAHVLGSSKNDFPFNPLVASGQLIGPNPNKLILKRSVLTGYPKSVEQHHAVIRHMFYNASDVNFFKTVELWTKFKTKGRIEKSRGLKGIFDASFEKTLTQKSPVHISLYKRQFPVWNPTYL